MTGIKLSGEIFPRNKNYAQFYTPLFRIKLNNDPLRYNGYKGVVNFDVYRIAGEELKVKNFLCYLGVASDSDLSTKIMFYDLNPEIGSPYVVVEVKDNYAYVYARGGNSGDFITYQIKYAGNASYIERLFDEDILISAVENPILPTKYKIPEVTLKNDWQLTTAYQRVYDTIGNRVDINFFVRSRVSTNLAENTVIATCTIPPRQKMLLTATYFDAFDRSITGTCLLNVETNGNITVNAGVKQETFIEIKLDYEFVI